MFHTYFTPCSSVSIVNFQHVNANWELLLLLLTLYLKLEKNYIALQKIYSLIYTN